MPRKRNKPLPEGVYERRHASGHTTYAIRFRDAAGRTVREAAGTSIADAVALRTRREREVSEGAHVPGRVRTVAQYGAQWTVKRVAEGVRTAAREAQLFRDFIAPHIGSAHIAELRPRDVAAWVRTLRTVEKSRGAGGLSPKSIRNAHGVLSAMLERARFDELIVSNPARDLPAGVLPDNERVRNVAAWTRDEIERLISDERIPEDRRVLYAIAAFTGARLGEVCGMRWRDIDDAQPLRRWMLRTQWDGAPLKTSRPRDVPIHAELWRILAAWKLEGWARWVRRVPRPDDLVVAREDGSGHRDNSAGSQSLRRHARAIGLETQGPAGSRDAHSFRRSFVTLARTDGAPAELVERITHNARGATIDGYSYYGWDALCDAVSKLRLARNEGRVIALRRVAGEHATEHAVFEGAANAPSSLVFSVPGAGLEPASAATVDRISREFRADRGPRAPCTAPENPGGSGGVAVNETRVLTRRGESMSKEQMSSRPWHERVAEFCAAGGRFELQHFSNPGWTCEMESEDGFVTGRGATLEEAVGQGFASLADEVADDD